MLEEQPSCTILPMSLTTDIRSYQPFNQQEASDREVILQQLEADPHVFDRDSLAHMTCSIWTVDPTVTQTLMVFHNTYGSWSWIGGHADGERDLAQVALRELEEETGLHAQNWQLLVDMDTTPGFCNEHIGIYLATGLSQHHMHTDEDEFLNVDRVPLSEAVRRVMAGEIHDSKTIAGLMMAWNLLGRQSDMPLDSLASIQRGSTAFASQAKE